VATILENYWTRHAKGLPSAEAAGIAIRHMKAFYGISPVSAINADSNDKYRDQCKAEGLAPGTINRRRSFLRAALRQAVKREELTTAPFIPGEREPGARPHALTREQAAAVLRAARQMPAHVALFVRIGLWTGARRGAILDLTWDRVDLEYGSINFRVPGGQETKKRRANTPIPLRLLSTLRRAYANSEGAYVIQWRGKKVASVKTAFKTLRRAVRLPWLTPHVLKHTFVTWGLRRADSWQLQGLTATSARTLEKIYGKHITDDMRAASEAIAQGKPTQFTRKSVSKKKPADAIKHRRERGGRDRV
jgi:integrase